MKIMIAGLGSIGRRHLHNLVALGETDLLLYRTHQSTLPDEELKDYPVETDLQACLAQKPDAVIISNPTALHMEVAIPAAEAGCHLLLEKPISNNLDRIPDLLHAAFESGSRIMVGFQFRFHPTLQHAYRLIRNDPIGTPLSVRAHGGEYLPDGHPWENYSQGYAARSDLGGGVVMTLSNPLDYLRWIFGDVESLWAFTSNRSGLDLSVEDTAEIGLRFASGVIGSVHLDYNQRPATHTLEVVGSGGTLRWDNSTGALSVYRAAEKTWQTYQALAGFERNVLFLEEIKSFLSMVENGTPPVCTLEDGVKALQIALAALQSAGDGQMVRLTP
jgi:predicted dehydrogenase